MAAITAIGIIPSTVNIVSELKVLVPRYTLFPSNEERESELKVLVPR